LSSVINVDLPEPIFPSMEIMGDFCKGKGDDDDDDDDITDLWDIL